MKRILKYGAWILIITIVFGSILIYANSRIINYSQKFIFETIDKIPDCEAAMVLGAKVNKNGTLPAITMDRAKTSIELYRAGKVKKILITGDHGHVGYDEVNTIRKYILSQGVLPAQDIFMDHAGFNTYSSMYRARDVFKVKSVIICTQKFHLDRAVYIARGMGISAYGMAADNLNYGKTVMDILNTRETGARLKAFIDINITHPKPHFLGDSIPITGDGRVTEDSK